MDDYQKNPFGFMEATRLHLEKNGGYGGGGSSQILVSEEEEEEEKRKSVSRVKIKFPNGNFIDCCRDEEQQPHRKLKNQKTELKVFHRKLKRTATTTNYACDESVQGNTKMNENDFSTTCSVCSKFFHSKKALFGHMRCHPERQWRGIQPPPPLMNTKIKKNSSSSTVSDSLVMNVDDQIDSASTSGRLGFDVSGSISNWPETAKRRRNVAISDHRILDAIDGLLMLVHGNSMDLVSRTRQRIKETDGMFMDLLSKNEELEVIEEVSERSKKRRSEESEAMNKSEDEYNGFSWKKVKVYHRNGGDLRSGFVPELMEMDCGDRMGVVDDDYNKQKPVSNISSNGFKCGTCNKSFTSHQALGGHKSSQRNCRNTSFQSDYHHQYRDVNCPNLIKVDQDLQEFNHTRPKDVDKHKCKVCGKTFPTGQALGGHQRCHWNSTSGAPVSSAVALPQMHNVETPSSSVASPEDPGKTNIKLLDFDLNEPPVDYDEECLSQLVPPVFGLTV